MRRAVSLILLSLIPILPATAAEPPLRIISLYAAHTEMLLRLGGRDLLVGISAQETYAGPETDGWQRPPVFSIRDDVEKYLAARPDLVLVRPQHLAGGARLVAALGRAGIRVEAQQVLRASELYRYWRELGELTGRRAEAEAIIREFATRVEEYRAAGAALSRRPGVFLEAMHREIKTFTPDSIPAWLVEVAGGTNVAADAAPAVPGVVIAAYGPERLVAAARRVEVFVSQQGPMNRVADGELRGRGLYRNLTAFKTGRVYRIPEAVLSRPTPSLLEGLARLSAWVAEAAGEEE